MYKIPLREIHEIGFNRDQKIKIIKDALKILNSYSFDDKVLEYEYSKIKILKKLRSDSKRKLNKYLSSHSILELNLDAFNRFFVDFKTLEVTFECEFMKNEEIINTMRRLVNPEAVFIK